MEFTGFRKLMELTRLKELIELTGLRKLKELTGLWGGGGDAGDFPGSGNSESHRIHKGPLKVLEATRNLELGKNKQLFPESFLQVVQGSPEMQLRGVITHLEAGLIRDIWVSGARPPSKGRWVGASLLLLSM